MGAVGGVVIVVAVIAVFTMMRLAGTRVGRMSSQGFDPPYLIDPHTGERVPQPGTSHHGGHHGGSGDGGHHGGHFGGFSGGGGGDSGGGGHHGH